MDSFARICTIPGIGTVTTGETAISRIGTRIFSVSARMVPGVAAMSAIAVVTARIVRAVPIRMISRVVTAGVMPRVVTAGVMAAVGVVRTVRIYYRSMWARTRPMVRIRRQ